MTTDGRFFLSFQVKRDYLGAWGRAGGIPPPQQNIEAAILAVSLSLSQAGIIRRSSSTKSAAASVPATLVPAAISESPASDSCR